MSIYDLFIKEKADEVNLWIKQGSDEYKPPIHDGIEWETEYYGSPSKLTFTVPKHGNLDFNEGAEIYLLVGNRPIFKGWVFEKSRDREHNIQVTAYDQLRYFANKHTLQYTNWTADKLVRQLCADFNLKTGIIEPTGFILPPRDEDNQTLFDMVESALELTYFNTRQEYCLYDNYGEINLRNVKNWVSDRLIDASRTENFDYTTSIDKDTYNRIVVYQESGEKGKRLMHVVEDASWQGAWGVLQDVVTVNEGDNPINIANMLFKLKCRPTRDLTVKGVQGDFDVRAGMKVPVLLNLGDDFRSNFMLCETVTHHIYAGKHTMDIKFYDDSEWIPKS